MSVHGENYILPLFLEKGSQRPIFETDDENINEELTLAFHILTRELGEDQKVLSFARLVWPFLAIQGVSKPDSTHIFLDGLQILSKKGKFTNPPRKPLIGHIMRNSDDRGAEEQLKRIIEVLKYEDKDAEKVGEGEMSEYQEFQIKSLVYPEFLHSLKILIPHLKYKSIKNYGQLDVGLSTENALDIAADYQNIIEQLEGNAHRWKEQIGLIGDELEKMLKSLNLKIKDTSLRYDSEIKKIKEEIDEDQGKQEIAAKYDELTQYKRKRKKDLIDNIAVLFKNIDDEIETILKKNKFFSNEEMLKRNTFKDLLPKLDNHIDYLKTQGNNFLSSLNSIEEKIQKIEQDAEDINKEVKNKLGQYEENIKKQLEERNQQIKAKEEEKKVKIQQLENSKNTLESLFSEIKQIIKTKAQDCLNEAQEIVNWSLKDDEVEAIKKPIQWIYMPIYAMFIEDEEMLEENMKLLLPGFIKKNTKDLYEVLSETFSDIGQGISDMVEGDMALRSNFEFSVENNNYIKKENFKERVTKSLDLLKNQSIITQEIENQLKETLQNL
jgi:hypothetical protein